MIHDGNLDIATGLSAKSKLWRNKQMTWSKFVKRISETNKTNETLADFVKATKEEQSKIKDVGGYVGAYLRASRRKPENVIHRQLLTLDLDFAKADLWFDFTLLFDCAAILHSTHKHSAAAPRFRLLIPLDREVSSDEYVAIARKVAGDIGIELFDNTTFETNRLMFWPSTPIDQDYYFEFQDGTWLNADQILNSYLDWTDTTQWPTATKVIEEIKNNATKQADPELKRGLIGAFCRAYDIHAAIETFLSSEYKRLDGDRYTYVKGSTSGGLITYDDKFSYSHHGTDPTSGMLCNAFDLVRVHKFDHLGPEKSLKEMEDLCKQDENTRIQIASDTIDSAKFDFGISEIEPVDLNWAKNLEVDGRGAYLSSSTNINLIFANDPRLKGKFKQNEFDNKKYVCGNLPWRLVKTPEPVKNVDFSGVRNYIETVYKISGSLKIDDSLNLEFERNIFHPVKDYLGSLQWDGVDRVDNLLIDYFGSDDNVYTREAIRKMLVGAVARIYDPGVKFDLVLTLVSEEGTGKSTFIKKLGKMWFSDTFMGVQGKEALEQIQGCWLIEMAELAGLRRAEVEAVKHFITKQEDTFRPAYGHVAETYKRQCVFFGTTNDLAFLKEATGNRRFMPIDVFPEMITKDVFSKEFDSEIDQIWAEAVYLYRKGESLFLSKEANLIANGERRNHTEIDERTGTIEQFLERKLPSNWNELDTDARKILLYDKEPTEGEKRQFVCIFEIWCECLGNKQSDANRYNTKDINQILKSLPEWESCKSTKNFSIYGKQRYYRRKVQST